MHGEKRRSSRRSSKRSPKTGPREPVGLRIVGGRFRGRKLLYDGRAGVRPMKDRVREAIFNLLGPDVRRKLAVDLFAGTGALGLEALSRGAERAVLIEQHFPTAEVIRRNVVTLGVADITEIITGNVFIWWRRRPKLPDSPWVVFCSPPYDFYLTRTDEMLELIGGLIASAPAGSLFAVESDTRFDFHLLPEPDAWDVRAYSPAVVGVYRKQGVAANTTTLRR